MKKIVSTLNAIYLATAPALAIYLLSNGIQFNWILIAILFFLNIIVGNVPGSFKDRKNEFCWFLIIFVLGFIGAIINTDIFYDDILFWHNLAGIVFFFIALINFTTYCNINVFIKTLYIIGGAAAVICIFQRAMLLITGAFFSNFFIPWLEVNRDIETLTENRVSAFFTEPAHLSIFLLPVFYLALNNKKFLLAVLYAAGILFSGSTTGLILLALLLLVFLGKMKIKKTTRFIIVVLLIITFFIIFTYFPDVFFDNFDKLSSTDSDSKRLLGPLSYIQLFKNFQIWFGIGLNQINGFLKMNGIIVTTDYGVVKNANYANSFIYMMLSYGIVGLVFYITYLIKTIRTHKSDIGFVIFAIGILASDQVLFNRNLLYVLTFLLLSSYLLTTNEKIE